MCIYIHIKDLKFNSKSYFESAPNQNYFTQIKISDEKGKHIERKYHIIWDIFARGDVVVAKIDSANNLADPFTKTLSQRTFELHLERMKVRLVHNSL